MHSLADPISKNPQRYPLACEPPEVLRKKYLEKLKNCRANKGSSLGPLVSVKGVKLTKSHRKPQIVKISQSKSKNSRDFYVKLGGLWSERTVNPYRFIPENPLFGDPPLTPPANRCSESNFEKSGTVGTQGTLKGGTAGSTSRADNFRPPCRLSN